LSSDYLNKPSFSITMYSIMPEIIPLPPERNEEARMVIYAVAHQLFDKNLTFDEAKEIYQEEWPIHDLDDPQRSYFENGGTFLVVIEKGEIIGTGALRRMEEEVGEIKRLWLLPAYQRQGLGYQVMVRLLAEARQRGYAKVRLATSPKYQVRAYQFYRQLGFYDIPRYNDDPDDVGMEMIL
jgi:putative acetyltransferase